MNAFITGTDTGVGKTYVTARLIRGLRASGIDAVGYKPLCCGSREDAETLGAASDGALSINEVNPVWLRAPVAPYAAAMIENRQIDLALIRETFTRLRAKHQAVIVEGVGGWLVPILSDFTVADLAVEWQLPVIVVVGNRLGALNHTVLTVRAIQSANVTCAGLIINEIPVSEQSDGRAEDGDRLARATNPGILEEWLRIPVLGVVGLNQTEISVQF